MSALAVRPAARPEPAELWHPQESASREPTLHPQELLSVYAVLAYIAHHQDAKQELVQAMLEAEFSVDSINKIPRRDYENVMTFLIDLRMDGLRSQR